jgi:hypothetical protein
VFHLVGVVDASRVTDLRLAGNERLPLVGNGIVLFDETEDVPFDVFLRAGLIS